MKHRSQYQSVMYRPTLTNEEIARMPVWDNNTKVGRHWGISQTGINEAEKEKLIWRNPFGEAAPIQEVKEP